jgi:hypothetical protein
MHSVSRIFDNLDIPVKKTGTDRSVDPLQLAVFTEGDSIVEDLLNKFPDARATFSADCPGTVRTFTGAKCQCDCKSTPGCRRLESSRRVPLLCRVARSPVIYA